MTVTASEGSLLETLPLFEGLAPKDRAELLKVSAVQRYSAGTILFQEGEQPVQLYVIISGTVEIFSTCGIRELGVMLMNAGDVFMPGAVLFKEPYTTSARTLGFCRLLHIDAQPVRAMAGTSAAFAMTLSRAMAGQYRAALRQLLDLKSRTGAQRLASFLLKFADTSGAPLPELPMRKRVLAARIGMTPETLSRALQILADNGLVVRGRQILIRDRERIERFCGPDPYCPAAEDELQVHVL